MSGSYSRELKVRPPGNPEINAPVTPPPQKKVLVTGATGFVGRAVIPELLQAGFDVRASFRNQSAHQNSTPNVEWVSIPDLESTEYEILLGRAISNKPKKERAKTRNTTEKAVFSHTLVEILFKNSGFTESRK